MLINQRQHESTPAASMNQVNSSQHPQDSAIKQLGPGMLQSRLPRAMGHENLRATDVRRAVEDQRLMLLNQPGSSSDRQLAALDILARRDFKPAKGGVEIPNGIAMGGMRSHRINAPISHAAIETIAPELRARMTDLQEQMMNKAHLINQLRQEIDSGNLSPQQVQLNRNAIDNATSELEDLRIQVRILADEARQAERGR